MSLVFSQKIRKIQKFSNPQKRFYFIKKKRGRKSKIGPAQLKIIGLGPLCENFSSLAQTVNEKWFIFLIAFFRIYILKNTRLQLRSAKRQIPPPAAHCVRRRGSWGDCRHTDDTLALTHPALPQTHNIPARNGHFCVNT